MKETSNINISTQILNKIAVLSAMELNLAMVEYTGSNSYSCSNYFSTFSTL
jgi:hypothetical protein